MTNICANPNCNNLAGLSKNGKTQLLHCSAKCKNQHNSISGNDKRKQTCLDRFGSTSNLSTVEYQVKRSRTCMEKYGVTHAMKSLASKEKLSQTKIEKYGDPTYNNREKFKETRNNWSVEKTADINNRRKQTNLEIHGVETTFASTIIQEKIKATNLERYGVENPSNSPGVITKIQETMKSRYGKRLFQQQHLTLETIELLNDITYLEKNKHRALQDIATETGVSYYTVDYAFSKYGIERTFIPNNISVIENEISTFIESFGLSVIKNSRHLISPKEIDIYVPEKKLAIEIDGLYWHCEFHKPDKNYHLDKTLACEKEGISLLHITDYECRTKKDLVKSRIKAKLGFIENSIYARKCEIKNVSAQEANDFLLKTHIQGYVPAGVRLGLYHENDLVALMTFGKTRYNKNYQYELLRYSSELDTNVVGGASKLFTHFIKNYNPNSIISYSDMRWNTGNLYEKLGFIFEKGTGPNYWYVRNYNSMESRVRYQKHKLENIISIYDPKLSEWENMMQNSYDRYWDCGSKVFVWNT